MLKQQSNAQTRGMMLIIGLMIFGAFTRIPTNTIFFHIANMASINAIALFSGASFKQMRTAVMITLLTVLLSDVCISQFLFSSWWPFYQGWYWQYSSYVLIVLLGIFLRERRQVFHIMMASFSASMLFFALSNFGVWYSSGMYPNTLPGLFACYVAALPFFKHTLLSDFIFSCVLFYTSAICFLLKLFFNRINHYLHRFYMAIFMAIN